MNEWRLDIDSWPGPDRKKWRGLRDFFCESPDGRYVAVLYSSSEIDISKEVGYFALLEEPKDSPKLLVRPRGLTCLVSGDAGRDVQWIENRFCAVTSYSLRPEFSLSGRLRQFYGAMIFDLKERRAAYVPGTAASEIASALPDNLPWKSWKHLSWWPRLWHK